MINHEKTKTDGWSNLKKILIPVGVVCIGIVAFLNNSTGVINNFIGISSFFHAKPAALATASQAKVNVSPAKAEADKVNSPAPSSKPVTQISSGNNSANVAGVQGSVRFQVDAQGTHTSLASPRKPSTRVVKPAAASVTQISTGDGSPNISNVGGDVDLNYSAPAKKDN